MSENIKKGNMKAEAPLSLLRNMMSMAACCSARPSLSRCTAEGRRLISAK